jgi:membrane AbrB-like protein
MVIAAAIHLSGIAELQLPQWLLVMAYTVLGWNIGLRFTTESLHHAWRSLPAILTSILSLIAFCGGVALIVSQLLRIDLLTAYLATSPGGADSIAIIAASSHVDIAMVMAVQVVRFLIVALLGPRLAQAVASTLPRATAQTSPAAARSRA